MKNWGKSICASPVKQSFDIRIGSFLLPICGSVSGSTILESMVVFPKVLILQLPCFLILSSLFFPSLFSFNFYIIPSSYHRLLLLLSFPSAHVCVHKCVHTRVTPHPCEWVYVSLRATILPQKSLHFSSVAFPAVAKAGPSRRCVSAANGGAGVGLPGHVSGWWPCQSITVDRCTRKRTLSEDGMRAL